MGQNDAMTEHDECLDDPILRFGFGIYTYIAFQKKLKLILAILSVISAIQMSIIYHDISPTEAEVLLKEKDKFSPTEYLTSYFSLGSYVQAYPYCHHVHLN